MTDTWSPRNEEQADAYGSCTHNAITFLLGPAGSGKTHVAVAAAQRLVERNTVSRIWLTRPLVECDEKLGYLKGRLDEKLEPWLAPFRDVNGGKMPRHVEAVPLGFMRGRTIWDSVAILDEAQNATRKQLVMFLSRLGRRGRVIVTGDTDQCDIRQPALPDVVRRLEGLTGVGVVTMRDAGVRHELLPEILRRLT